MLQLVRVLEAHHRHIDGWPQATNPYQHNHGDGKDAPVGSREVFEKKHQVSFPFRVYASVTTPADGRQCLRKLQRSSSPDCIAAPGQRLSPRSACTVLCSDGALTASGVTGAAATSSTRDQKRFGSLASALPSLWLKKLPHSPRNAIGTPGTGLRAMIFSMPLRNSSISPSVVSLPSGKMHTTSPASSSTAMRSNAWS